MAVAVDAGVITAEQGEQMKAAWERHLQS
ncbi:DUF2680 domain-containing protein [Streptomyces sp. NPDC050264]